MLKASNEELNTSKRATPVVFVPILISIIDNKRVKEFPSTNINTNLKIKLFINVVTKLKIY
jgi:hypothetical protein